MAWTPKYIKRTIADKPRYRVNAEYWNGLWNLLIAQGDNNTTGIVEIMKNAKDKHYVHKQETSSDTWEVTHGLGKEPAVTVIDSAGTEVIGEVEYVGLNKCILRFQAPFSGKAIFN